MIPAEATRAAKARANEGEVPETRASSELSQATMSEHSEPRVATLSGGSQVLSAPALARAATKSPKDRRECVGTSVGCYEDFDSVGEASLLGAKVSSRSPWGFMTLEVSSMTTTLSRTLPMPVM